MGRQRANDWLSEHLQQPTYNQRIIIILTFKTRARLTTLVVGVVTSFGICIFSNNLHTQNIRMPRNAHYYYYSFSASSSLQSLVISSIVAWLNACPFNGANYILLSHFLHSSFLPSLLPSVPSCLLPHSFTTRWLSLPSSSWMDWTRHGGVRRSS